MGCCVENCGRRTPGSESTDSKISGTVLLVNAGTHTAALGRLSFTHYTTHLSNIHSSAAVVSVAAPLSHSVAPVAPATIISIWPGLTSASALGRHDQLHFCLRYAAPRTSIHLTRLHLKTSTTTQHPHTFFARAPHRLPHLCRALPSFAALSLTAVAAAVLPWAQHSHAADSRPFLSQPHRTASSRTALSAESEFRLHFLHNIHYFPINHRILRLPRLHTSD